MAVASDSDNLANLQLLDFGYNGWMVALSIVIACASAILAVQVVEFSKQFPNNKRIRHVAIATGSVALGSGVWGMHFIGMLALHLHAPVNYQLDLTLLSGLPSLLAAWVAFSHLYNGKHVLLGGVMMGCGISTMHYLGMSAMQVDNASLHYDKGWFAVSHVGRHGVGDLVDQDLRPLADWSIVTHHERVGHELCRVEHALHGHVFS